MSVTIWSSGLATVSVSVSAVAPAAIAEYWGIEHQDRMQEVHQLHLRQGHMHRIRGRMRRFRGRYAGVTPEPQPP